MQLHEAEAALQRLAAEGGLPYTPSRARSPGPDSDCLSAVSSLGPRQLTFTGRPWSLLSSESGISKQQLWRLPCSKSAMRRSAQRAL